VDKVVDKFMTIKAAADQLKISERTVRRRIASGELPSRRVGRRVYVELDNEAAEPDKTPLQQVMGKWPGDETIEEILAVLRETSKTPDTEMTIQLRSEIEHLRQQLQAYEERSQRQDTIILQLTRQLEQSQKLLEYNRAPFWRRWFSKNGYK